MAVAAPAAETRPSFDIVRISPSGEAVFAGRAAPGSSVTVTDNGIRIAEATSDADGQWVALPKTSLPAGGQQLALSSLTRSGADVAGEVPLVVVVPGRQTATAGSPAAAPAAAVAILTPPNAAPRVLQGLPGPEPAGERPGGRKALNLDVVDYDEHGAIRFGGTAKPGATVRAYVDDRPAGDAVADSEGHWSLDPGQAVPPGDHRLRVDQVATGHVAARIEVPFERTSLPAADVREGRIVVQPRQTLWRIARHAYGQGIRYTVIYQANRDQIRNPNLIFPGQVFDLPSGQAAAAPTSAAQAASTPEPTVSSISR